MWRRRRNGARDLARDAPRIGKVRRAVAATGPSVAEAHRAGHVFSDADGEHERGSAGEAAMEIRHAAARRARMILVQDVPAKRRAAGPDDLRDRALEVLPAYAIDAPKRAEQTLSAG